MAPSFRIWHMDRHGGLAPDAWISDLKSAWVGVTSDFINPTLEGLIVHITKEVPSVDMIRSMFCQALLYRSNSKAKTSLANGTYKRCWESSNDILIELHTLLDAFTMNAQEELLIRHLYTEFNAKVRRVDSANSTGLVHRKYVGFCWVHVPTVQRRGQK